MTDTNLMHRNIARNSILNFFGQLVPLVVGVVSIPFVLKGMGIDNFGILSLSWMLLGYFTIFDLGLGRATTKFIAEESHKSQTDRLRSIFWTSLLLNFSLGCAGGAVIASFSSVLARSVFQIPPGLQDVAHHTFLLLGVSLPIVLVSTVFRGTLEAAQRFDYVSSVVLVSSSLTYLLPLAGTLIGLDIFAIVLLLMIARLCSALVYLYLCRRVFPVLRSGMAIDGAVGRKMLSFGGWVSVSNVVNPVLIYLDRFLIGTLISVAAVAYYTAPFEMVARVLILAMSIAMTLFPSFSASDGSDRTQLSRLYSRAMKILLLMVGPVVAALVLFSDEILTLWLGAGFAHVSVQVFRILAVGILFNSIAQIPYVLIQGVGYPNISAKFHLMELVVYIPLIWILVKYFGIVGGALGWTLRVCADMVLLTAGSLRFIIPGTFAERRMRSTIAIVCVMVLPVIGLSMIEIPIAFKAVAAVVILVPSILLSWRYILDDGEKGWVVGAVKSVAGAAARARQ